ncbi:MAG: hypothetical protein H6730_08415 [Deltaproteobacteria bacterium]|nr:hypothetical protein [Deltaproteobacteria bacterium]
MASTKLRERRGSSSPPSSRVSALARMIDTGVRSSCETLATKSFRTVSRRRISVTSCITTTVPASIDIGVARASTRCSP